MPQKHLHHISLTTHTRIDIGPHLHPLPPLEAAPIHSQKHLHHRPDPPPNSQWSVPSSHKERECMRRPRAQGPCGPGHSGRATVNLGAQALIERHVEGSGAWQECDRLSGQLRLRQATSWAEMTQTRHHSRAVRIPRPRISVLDYNRHIIARALLLSFILAESDREQLLSWKSGTVTSTAGGKWSL